jgi:hypothetical protein
MNMAAGTEGHIAQTDAEATDLRGAFLLDWIPPLTRCANIVSSCAWLHAEPATTSLWNATTS